MVFLKWNFKSPLIKIKAVNKSATASLVCDRSKIWLNLFHPLYERHWIPRRVRIVEPIQKSPPHPKKKGIRCHMLRVTCQMSLTPTATAMDPPPAKVLTMQSRMVFDFFQCGDLIPFLSQNFQILRTLPSCNFYVRFLL